MLSKRLMRLNLIFLFVERLAPTRPLVPSRSHMVNSFRNHTVNSSLLSSISEIKRAQLQDRFSWLKTMASNSKLNVTKQIINKTNCEHYKKIASRNRSATTVYNIFSNKITNTDEVTLVTHLTLNRFFMLIRLMKQWSGPLSVALLVLVTEHDLFWRKINEKNLFHPSLMLHVVIDKKVNQKNIVYMSGVGHLWGNNLILICALKLSIDIENY